MISKEKAIEIAKQYLADKKREYLNISSPENVALNENESILYGSKMGEKSDQYSVWYSVEWGLEEKRHFIQIDTITGEVLFSLSQHGVIEAIESDLRE